MPTINQLVRKGRVSKSKKSDSPALNKGYNSYKKRMTISLLHRNVVFAHVSVQ